MLVSFLMGMGSNSKSRGPCGHEGSTPSFGTNKINHIPLRSENARFFANCGYQENTDDPA